jgi:hypothetical protein
MYYRGPDFLAVAGFGSFPLPSLPSVSATGDTQEDRKRETTRLWWERGEGMGKEPNHTTARKSGPL